MSKNIDTLLPDIKAMLEGKNAALEPDNFLAFAKNVSLLAIRQLGEEIKGPRPTDMVRASELGTRCLRQFHYKVNNPGEALELDSATRFKFIYGNLIEETVLLLAREAGHSVEREQEEVMAHTPVGNRVVGHIDAVIDGIVVDVKSTSPYGFEKMVNKDDWEDSFGYKPQLAFYAWYIPGLRLDQDNPPRFLLADKVSGKLGFSYFDEEEHDPKTVLDKADHLLDAARNPVDLLDRMKTVSHARGQTLGTVCSYCPYKKLCWKDANNGLGLRAFVYSTGPVFFTAIKKAALSEPEFLKREIKLGP